MKRLFLCNSARTLLAARPTRGYVDRILRPICRFCRSVPPGSLAFADAVTDCGYSRAFTYPPSVSGVSYAGHAALWFNASACALFRAVLPWAYARCAAAGRHETLCRTRRPIRRAARKKVAIVRFMSDRFRVPATRRTDAKQMRI
jgi:hypothetical protein